MGAIEAPEHGALVSRVGYFDPRAPRYSIGTLVTDMAQHHAMRASFAAANFDQSCCEFLFIDNADEAQADAYAGLNALLNAARGEIVILCHQDVRLIDRLLVLERRLADLDRLDPTWAVAGNAGGIAPGKLAMRISDPHGQNRAVGDLPARAQALDENLLIVKRSARIGFSHDLSGFHFYGADICLHAAQMGCSAYVIDFHLEHLSPGRKGLDFENAERAFRTKWSRAFRPRWVQTTCSLVRVSGAPLRGVIGRFIDAPLAKIAKRMPGAEGWTPRPRTLP